MGSSPTAPTTLIYRLSLTVKRWSPKPKMDVRLVPPVPISSVGYVYAITVPVTTDTEIPVKNQSDAYDVLRALGNFHIRVAQWQGASSQ